MKLSEISNCNDICDIISEPKYKHYPEKIQDFIKRRMKFPSNFNENTDYTLSGDYGFTWNVDERGYYIMSELDFSSIPNPEKEYVFISKDKSRKITITDLETRQNFIDLEKHRIDLKSFDKITYGMLPEWAISLVKMELKHVNNVYNPKTTVVSGLSNNGFNFTESKIGYHFWRLVYELSLEDAFRNCFKSKMIIKDSKNDNGIPTFEIINHNNSWRVTIENN